MKVTAVCSVPLVVSLTVGLVCTGFDQNSSRQQHGSGLPRVQQMLEARESPHPDVGGATGNPLHF